MNRTFWIFLYAAVLLLGGAALAGAEDAFYIYQPGNFFGAQGDLTLETETAYGTREARLLGDDAFEQGLRLRVSGTDWLSFEAWGGMVFQTNEEVKEENGAQDVAFAGDIYARALNQDDHLINLNFGLGYLYDYQQTSIPRVRVVISRSWGNFDVTLGAVGEIPLKKEEGEEEGEEGEAGEEEAEEEEGAYDEVDLAFNAAASYGFTDWFRLGAEAVLEDTEGFWEEEEAEGGAKLVTGPTASFAATDQFHIRLNTAAVVPVTTNNQTRVVGGSNQNDTGFMGRMTLAYRF